MANASFGGGLVVQIEAATARNSVFLFALTDEGKVFIIEAPELANSHWAEINPPPAQQTAD